MQMQIIIEKFLRSEKSKSFKLNSHDRILLFILSSYMGNKNMCWPNYESLMKDCGMAKATLSKSIKKLVSLDLLLIIQKRIKGSYKCSNSYQFSSSLLELENNSQVQNDQLSSSKRPHSQVQHVNSNNIINNINNNNGFSNQKSQKPIFASVETQSTAYQKLDTKPLTRIGLEAKEEVMRKLGLRRLSR